MIATLTASSRPRPRSPPATAQAGAPSPLIPAMRPSAKSSTQETRVSGGMVRLTTREVARAPMALMSLRFCAAAFQPTS